MTPTNLSGLVDPESLVSDRQFSMNLARGLEVLRAFTPAAPQLGNREIADRTGLPKPTISRLTYTLTLLGYLIHDAEQRTYRLGSGVLSLGHPLLATMPVRHVARPLMEGLANATGCTVNLGMRDRDMVVFIDTVRAADRNPYSPDIGTTRPLLRTSIGRALVLACPPTEREAILNHIKVRDRDLFDKDRATWEADVRRFVAHGFCHSRGEWRKDIHAVAVPLRRPPNQPPLAMNCTLMVYGTPRNKLVREVAPLLLETVRQLEAAEGLQ